MSITFPVDVTLTYKEVANAMIDNPEFFMDVLAELAVTASPGEMAGAGYIHEVHRDIIQFMADLKVEINSV